ncbi:arginine deiminase [bacterium]|nr:arginine deiminase [bacterium]
MIAPHREDFLKRFRLNVCNEFSPLKALVVHRPGDELDRLTPGNVQGFLLEDIPYLKQMQMEHDAFCRVLRENGVDVLMLSDLVHDVVASESGRARLVQEACELNHNPALSKPILDHFSVDATTRLIFHGLTEQEFAQASGSAPSSAQVHHDRFLIDPLPNAYFTRDPAFVFRDEVISCNAHYPARIRETWVTHTVLELHPSFTGTKFIFGDSDLEARPFTIEGGDIIVLNDESIAIGRSERTRSETIELVAGKLFAAGQAKRVYEVVIPPERVYMHLDTVFTIVGPRTVVLFPPVVEHGPSILRYEANPDGGRPISRRDDRSVLQILSDELGGDLNVIRTANGDLRYAAREQRSAGSNMLAIAPDRVISYERNVHTNRALRDAGVDVLEIPGSELVRGLGGPRCMSMPLERSDG